jgi:two-component system OmpR family sensor kinase
VFRSLATRLVALYVFVAVALVVLVGGTVTAFSLWMFARGTNEAVTSVAREAPVLVRLYRSRHRTLADAAPEIVQRLSRPGLRVAVFETVNGMHRPLAMDDPASQESGEHVIVFHGGAEGGASARVVGPMVVEKPPGGPPPGGMVGDGAGGPPEHLGFEHGPSLPFGLGRLLHARPKWVTVTGGTVVVMIDARPIARTISAFWMAIVPIGLLAVLAAWLLGRYITNQALRPLIETTSALRRFAGGDFTPRAIVSAERNEIGELVTAYNGAVRQVNAAFEERRLAEAQMRRFVADAGHELRTPLTVVMGFIDVLRRRGVHDPTTTRIFDTMMAESRRMRALIEKLIQLARLEKAEQQREPREVDLSFLVGRVADAMVALDPQNRLRARVEPGIAVRGDDTELYDAIANVVENALKYAPGAPVELDLRAEPEVAVVAVRDHGPGIADDERSLVFERFYRGRQRGETEGFGLGLAIAKRVAERAGGEISVESVPGGGTCFTIRLPRLAATRPGARPPLEGIA